jgi:hypothetical protein
MEPRRRHQVTLEDLMSMAAGGDTDEDILSGIDWSNPESFFRMMGGPIPKIATAEEIRHESRGRVKKILANYETLGRILDRHEATIHKRWTKRNKNQRLKLLLEAWPDMPTSHRPDFVAFRKESPAQREAATRFRGSFMWPYINQEDLSTNKALLLLLDARGRHPPPDFAGLDHDSYHLGRVSKALTPAFLNLYSMILNGAAATASEYGKLVDWDTDPEGCWKVSTGRQFMPGDGLLVLEIQDRILGFLVACCKLLLHDISEHDLTSDAYPVLPGPNFTSDAALNGFESLAVLAAEAPYRPPSRIDWPRIESMLAAQVADCESHILELREDPGYFADRLSTQKEHRLEMLPDVNGQKHPYLGPSGNGNTLFWTFVVRNFLAEAYLRYEIFSELRNQAGSLGMLHEKYGTRLSPSRDLPGVYRKALLRFKHYLSQAAKGPISQLKITCASSPPLRRFFVRLPSENPVKISCRERSNVKTTAVERHLLWLLRNLWEDNYDLFLITLPNAIDELQRHRDAEPQADVLISPYVNDVIAELSIITECMRQVDNFHPWAGSFEADMAEGQKAIQEEFASTTKPLAALMTFSNHCGPGIIQLGQPDGKRFAYPVSKRRTKENVDLLRAAEANLDAFWRAVDQVMYAKAGSEIKGSATERFLKEARTLQRTPVWVEPARVEKTAGKAIQPPVQPDDLSGLMSTIYIGESAKESEPEVVKQKIKTKGTTTDQSPAAAVPKTDDEEISKSSHATLAVDSRALRVFKTLFFDPCSTGTPGEIPWNDFLHAITTTGFEARKLYGSIWQFSNATAARGIQFHEPHPSGKIPFTTARRMGRRLNRAYGWVGATFVQREK